MLKIVFFLVVVAFVLGAGLGILVFSLQFIGYALAFLFKLAVRVFRQLELVFCWVIARWQAWLKVADAPAATIPAPQEQVDVPTPQSEPQVIPVLESPELVQA